MRKLFAVPAAMSLALLPMAALAQAPEGQVDVADTGDTAWILISAALVLLMTMPGLSLFYGGLVRAKNFLSVMLQCGAVAAIASLLWIITGYTLAFGDVSNGVLGAGIDLWQMFDPQTHDTLVVFGESKPPAPAIVPPSWTRSTPPGQPDGGAR